jgi:hypothetical protein
LIDVVVSIAVSFGHYVIWTVILVVLDHTIRLIKLRKTVKKFEGSDYRKEKRDAGEWRDD